MPLEKIADYNNHRIKIKTVDGNQYKLRWIEEKGDTIKSIQNTKKVLIDIEQVEDIRIENSSISIDSAIRHKGIFQVETKNKIYVLSDIEEQGTQIRGIKIKKGQLSTVLIPKDRIEKIKVKNNTASAVATVALVGTLGVLGIFYLFSWSW